MIRVPGGAIPSAQRGISWLEFAVSALLISVFAGWLLVELNRYQELGEKAMVELTITHIRSGLRGKVAELLVANRRGEIPRLEGTNPVDFLEKPPAGYRGPLHGAVAEEQPGGSWYFDTERRELVYVVHLGRRFEPEPGQPKVVRLKVLFRADAGAPGFERAAEGIGLTRSLYRW